MEEALPREARARGHTVKRISFETACLNAGDTVFEDTGLLDCDILYYRTSLGYMWSQALERYLEKHGRKAHNLIALEHPYLEKKTYQIMVAVEHGITVPLTILDTTDEYAALVEQLGSPFIAKADVSSQGRNVHMISSPEEFVPIVAGRDEMQYFYQEYIPHTHDCRIHLVEGKAVASYKRIPMKGDFRSNVSRGAEMKGLTEEEKEALYPLAERVAEVFGLDIHVVDFLPRTTDGTYFMAEINSNPGWAKWNMEATGVHMNALVLDYFERTAHGLPDA